MKIVGIDPGTYSFDIFGMENDKNIIVDEAIKSEDVLADYHILIDKLEALMPLDIIVGPSGYGLPTKFIKDLREDDIDKMIPLDTGVAVNIGIKNAIMEMQHREMPVCFTPGVIHLPTLPSYRKWNFFDMGTADKVCCLALGIKDQAERLNLSFNETSFIFVEIGYGFTTVVAVYNGKIIDGIGGTNGSIGFIGCGGMDAEIAIRLKPPLTQEMIFSGGVKDFIGQDIDPRDLINHKEALMLFSERIEKDVASMLVSLPNPLEIILSGRLLTYDFIENSLRNRLDKYAPVVKVNKISKIAKEAACGAYIIGNGILGGKYREIVQNMSIIVAE